VEVRSFPAFRAVEICVYVFLVSFIFVLTGRFSSKRPAGRRCSGSCRRRRAWSDFLLHLYFFKPDLPSFIGFCETRASQSRSPSNSSLAVTCIGHAGHLWPACDHHALGILFSLGARDGHALSFLAVQRWCPGIWGPICCKVTPGTARVLREHFSDEDSFPCRRLGLSFSVCCVCVFPLFLQSQSVFVLLNFYWNIYWLVARSTIFC